jgi:hypothetical protein
MELYACEVFMSANSLSDKLEIVVLSRCRSFGMTPLSPDGEYALGLKIGLDDGDLPPVCL